MPTALVITHVAFEDPGSLGPELLRAGYTIELLEASIANLAAIDPLAADLLVVLGGPIGVYETAAYPFVQTEIALLQARLAAQRPTLGICLGAQLMAAALGAKVYPGRAGKEIGWSPLRAGPQAARCTGFAGLLASGLSVLHWHGDTFDLPQGALHLASSALYPNQAFAIGNYALGLQFHPEVTTQGLERWYVGHASELAAAGVDIPGLRASSHVHAPLLESAARRFWQTWLGQLAQEQDR